jgi:hypothetical protein
MVCLLNLLLAGGCAAEEARSPASAQADELERRWAIQYLKLDDPKEIARLDTVTEAHLKTIRPDGQFSDLTYAPTITSRDGGPGWGEHLLRTVDLFTAWRTPGTRVHRDRAFAERIKPAIESYLAAPFDMADKWGFGHPYADLLENNRIGRICLFARSDPEAFPQADVERWANAILKRAVHPVFVLKPDGTLERGSPLLEGGANLLWAIRGEIVPYLVSSDPALRVRAIDTYMNFAWNSQRVRSPKGPYGQIERLTLDGMLGEHYLPAMGSYGEWYINDVISYRDLIQGVDRWQMPPDLNAHWVDILLDSVAHCYQGAIDPHLCAPLVWINARKLSNAKLRAWLTAFRPAGHRVEEIDRLLAWEPGVTDWPIKDASIKYYYTTDYMTKHYPRHMASLRAVSERTYGSETFSQKDNRLAIDSIMLSLGTIIVRREGKEFQDTSTKGVFTAYDFARLPGQTTRHVTGSALAAAWNRDASGYAVRSVFGGTSFSGGVTTAHTGVMAWGQSRYLNVDRDRPWETKLTDLSVNGRRATFFLEDAIVNLGAGFDLRHPEPTYTSLAQHQSGPNTVTCAVGEEIRTVPRGQILRDANVRWVWYDHVGYLPPEDGVKVVQDVEQQGSPNQQVFSIWSDHGNTEKSLSFDWAIFPGVNAEQMPGLVANKSWTIVANSVNVQAIEVVSKQWAGLVFHKPDAVEVLGQSVRVDRPVVMIIETIDSELAVRVGDPLQQGGRLIVTIGGRAIDIDLPNHPNLGMPIEKRVPIK